MKMLFLVVAALSVAGCVSGQIADGKLSAGGFGVGLRDLTDVHERTVRLDVFERNADEDAAADREIRLAEAKAEVRKLEAEARYIEAWAGRVNPADGKQLERLLERQERLFAAWEAEAENEFTAVGRELRMSIFDEIQETRQLIYEFLHETGAPASYYGGMGGLPSVMSIGGMPMPGMGMPVGGVLQRDHTRGRIVNETDGMIYVTVEGTEVQIRPQDAVAMILPPGSYRYTAQKITGTAIGPIASVTIGGDLRVDDRWEEDIHQGWELRFRPWAFPR